MVEFPAKNSAIIAGKELDRALEGTLSSLRLYFRTPLCFETEDSVMGVIEECVLRKRGKWVFKITGGSSSFIAYIAKEVTFEEEENPFFFDSPAVFSGEKLAGTGGGLAGKGR